MAVQQRFDVRDRPAGHFLVDRADDAPLDLLVECLLEYAERLGRSDDGERIEIVAQDAGPELVRGVLDPAVFLLLVEVGLLVGRMTRSEALLHRAGSVGLDLSVLAILPRVMRFGPEVDLALVAMIAEEQHLAAVGDQDQRIVGKGHERSSCDSCLEENADWRRPVAAVRRAFRHAGLDPAPASFCLHKQKEKTVPGSRPG